MKRKVQALLNDIDTQARVIERAVPAGGVAQEAVQEIYNRTAEIRVFLDPVGA